MINVPLAEPSHIVDHSLTTTSFTSSSLEAQAPKTINVFPLYRIRIHQSHREVPLPPLPSLKPYATFLLAFCQYSAILSPRSDSRGSRNALEQVAECSEIGGRFHRNRHIVDILFDQVKKVLEIKKSRIMRDVSASC